MAAAARKPYAPRESWYEPFLAAFAKTGNITAAADAARVARSTVYAARKEDTEFAAAFKEARKRFMARLEKEAVRRAVEGYKRRKGVYYEGAKVADEIETVYSDTLMIFLMKANNPKKYREPVQRIAQTDAAGNDVKHNSEDARYARLLALLDRGGARGSSDAGSAGEGDLDAAGRATDPGLPEQG